MSKQSFSVEGVLEALAVQPFRRGAGRALMLVSAQRGEGVTTAACAIAQACKNTNVYAIDLNLKRNGLAKALSEYAPLGPKQDGEVHGVSLFGVGSLISPAFNFHRVGQTRIKAGVFDSRAVPVNARVVVPPGPAYWDAIRAEGAVAIVDAPSLDRSDIALRLARHMDGVVLVVGADAGAAPAASRAKQALVEAGANLLGLIYAGADASVVLIERVLRRAV
ncbi:MAG: hypothetical protein JNJ63_01505 [Hyphomonadaceae bacterium]|nr:hypothetical protein [Hyphomonadaceae bacterium]